MPGADIGAPSRPASAASAEALARDDTALASLCAARRLVRQGQDAAARQCYLDLLRQEPGCVGALIEFATLAETGGFRAAARTALRRAIAIAPGHPLALASLGNSLADMGDHTAAQAQYQAALAADPNHAPAHRGMARCLLALGDGGDRVPLPRRVARGLHC